MSLKRIFTGDRANIVTGHRVKKRRPFGILDVERHAMDKIHPIRVEVDGHTTLELADAEAFELAMALLEHALPATYLTEPINRKRLMELAVNVEAASRKGGQQ